MLLLKVLGGLRNAGAALQPVLDPAPVKGDTGAAGAAGAQGPKGDTGAQGQKGDPGAVGAKGDAGATGPAGATGAAGAKGDKGDTGATGATGPAGAPISALPDISITETSLVTLAIGLRKVTVTCAGALVGDRLQIFPQSYRLNGGASVNGTPPGYAVHDAVVTAANTVVVTLTVPFLAVATTYAIACKAVAFR